MSGKDRFSRFSHAVAHHAGRPGVFLLACLGIVAWAVTGPLFDFSETWQLVVNTTTTIITFLMVFILQNTQNRDGMAIQAKLDELIRASSSENRYIHLEDLTEEEILKLRQLCDERSRGRQGQDGPGSPATGR